MAVDSLSEMELLMLWSCFLNGSLLPQTYLNQKAPPV